MILIIAFISTKIREVNMCSNGSAHLLWTRHLQTCNADRTWFSDLSGPPIPATNLNPCGRHTRMTEKGFHRIGNSTKSYKEKRHTLGRIMGSRGQRKKFSIQRCVILLQQWDISVGFALELNLSYSQRRRFHSTCNAKMYYDNEGI